MKITHMEYCVEVIFVCKTRRSARKARLPKRIAASIYDAILRAAKEKIREHVKAGRLPKGFGVEIP